jgi:hypothetical protein
MKTSPRRNTGSRITHALRTTSHPAERARARDLALERMSQLDRLPDSWRSPSPKMSFNVILETRLSVDDLRGVARARNDKELLPSARFVKKNLRRLRSREATKSARFPAGADAKRCFPDKLQPNHVALNISG